MDKLRLPLLLCLALCGGTAYGAAADDFSNMFGTYGDFFQDSLDRRRHTDDVRRIDRRLDARAAEEEEERLEEEKAEAGGKSNAPETTDGTSSRSDKDSYQSKDDWIKRDNNKDSFTGASFDASTFIDTDFSRQSFMDSLKIQPPPDAPAKPLLAASVRVDDDGGGSESEQPVDPSAMQDAPDVEDDTWKELTMPMHSLIGDWVPSKPDPIHMGGFEKEPDNGSPVPYRLNGHVDMERGLPWEPSQ